MNKAWNLQVKLMKDQVVDLTTQNTLQQPLASKQPMETEHAILPSNSLAKIQTYEKKSKKPMKDIHLHSQTVQLQVDIETSQHEVLDLKGWLAMMEANKRTWEEEKQNMQKIIDELNYYSTPEERSSTALAIKYISEMSLKDLEISQLKEAN